MHLQCHFDLETVLLKVKSNVKTTVLLYQLQEDLPEEDSVFCAPVKAVRRAHRRADRRPVLVPVVLVRMLLNQALRRLTETLSFEGGRQVQHYRHPLLLMLDEFPALGRLAFFQESLAYLAGGLLLAMLLVLCAAA